MAFTTTTWWDLVTALLATMRANTTIVTTYNTLVNDGPLLTDASRPNILFVGAQPSQAGEGGPDGAIAQSWGELGARARYEDLSVACELVVRAGDTSMASRRATAKAILAAVESDLRTNVSLSVTGLLWCHITDAEFVQEQTNNGSTVLVRFTVTGRARLASQ